MTDKFCKDCLWYNGRYKSRTPVGDSLCIHSKSLIEETYDEDYLLNGRNVRHYTKAIDMRNDETKCGVSARYHEKV